LNIFPEPSASTNLIYWLLYSSWLTINKYKSLFTQTPSTNCKSFKKYNWFILIYLKIIFNAYNDNLHQIYTIFTDKICRFFDYLILILHEEVHNHLQTCNYHEQRMGKVLLVVFFSFIFLDFVLWLHEQIDSCFQTYKNLE
jgi:hypothetical protein